MRLPSGQSASTHVTCKTYIPSSGCKHPNVLACLRPPPLGLQLLEPAAKGGSSPHHGTPSTASGTDPTAARTYPSSASRSASAEADLRTGKRRSVSATVGLEFPAA